MAQTVEEYQHIPIRSLFPSILNKRDHVDKAADDDTRASIAQDGWRGDDKGFDQLARDLGVNPTPVRKRIQSEAAAKRKKTAKKKTVTKKTTKRRAKK